MNLSLLRYKFFHIKFNLDRRKKIFLILSFISLLTGILCYLFFRPSFIFHINIFKMEKFDKLVFFNFLRYNLPDGLWLISGIFLLRAIWIRNYLISQVYIGTLIIFSLLFEILQYFNITPGTFDAIDLIFMGIIALVEQIIYFLFLKE